MNEKRKIAFAFISIGLFVAVIALGYAVTAGRFHGPDLAISHALNLHRGASPDWLILFMQGVSWIGGGLQRYIMVTLLVAVLWRWRGGRAGLTMGLIALVSSLTSDMMKLFFARMRPDLVPHLDSVNSYAFPSGHAANAAVVYALIIILIPQARRSLWQGIAAAMILLTGLSRIMLGVHWPTDVVGGWMLGMAFIFGAAAVMAYQPPRTAKSPSAPAL